MVRKRTDRKIPSLEPFFKDVFVCKEKKERPFLEVFVEAPENINLENLGTIAGILEITDYSENSSYIVNYLISVIKKEYFSQAKRGPIESFEAALHKANLALAKLAEHDHVSWIGQLNAVCLVCEKNNVHLSQSGNAKAFLLRSQMMTNICEGDPDQIEPNPMKTFEDVISGRLEENDKLVITTEAIFDILSPQELNRNAVKFSEDKFIQFLRTALINELDRAAVLVVDIKEKKEVEPPATLTIPKKSKLNVFSQEAFIAKAQNKTLAQSPPLDTTKKREIAEEIRKNLKDNREDLTDKESGHLYIVASGEEPQPSESAFEQLRSNLFQGLANTKNNVLSRLKKLSPGSYWTNLKGKTNSLSIKRNPPAKNASPDTSFDNYNYPEKSSEESSPDIHLKIKSSTIFDQLLIGKDKLIVLFGITKVRLAAFSRKIGPFLSGAIFFASAFGKNRILLPLKNLYLLTRKKIPDWKSSRPQESVSEEDPIQKTDYAANPQSLAASRTEKKRWLNNLSGLMANNIPNNFRKDVSAKLSTGTKKVLPDFSKLSQLISQMDYQKRIYAIIFLICLFVVPYFIVKIQTKLSTQKETNPTPLVASVVPTPLEQDKNVIRTNNAKTNYTGTDIAKIISLNGQVLAIDEDKIINLSNENKEYPLPTNFQNPPLVSGMEDLNLIILIKGGQALSFSPSAGKFQENKISIPSDAQISASGTYLTYLYLLDSQNNQIYRYPRAEGGFGEKTNWLKESSTDLGQMKDMAISENVFVTDGKEIFQFSRGKKQAFSLEETATQIIPSQLFAQEDKENLYVLDTPNSRIIKLDRSGQIINQFYHSDLASAKSLAIDEEKEIAYFSNGKEVKSFEMK